MGYYEFCLECGGSEQSENIDIPELNHENGQELKKLFQELNIKSYGRH